MSWWKRLGDWIDWHDTRANHERDADDDVWSHPAPCSICGKPGRFRMGDAFCPDHAPGCSLVEAGPHVRQLSLTTDGASARPSTPLYQGDEWRTLPADVLAHKLANDLRIIRIDRAEWKERCAQKDELIRNLNEQLDFHATRERELIGAMAILRRDLGEATEKLAIAEGMVQTALDANRAARRRKRSKIRSGAKR